MTSSIQRRNNTQKKKKKKKDMQKNTRVRKQTRIYLHGVAQQPPCEARQICVIEISRSLLEL